MTTGLLEGTRSLKARTGRMADAPERRSDAPVPARAPSGLSHVWPWGRRIKEHDLMSLCQHLGALTGSGVSLAQCLTTFADEAPRGPLRDVLQEIIADIQDGRKLSDALARHPDDFSPHFRASIWAGETSGNMAETLERLAKYLENKIETRQRVRNAFAYPIVLLLVIAGVVSFLMLYVVPVFSAVYAKMGVKLPAVTQALVDISHVLVTKPYVLIVPIVLVVGVGYWTRRTDAGRLWLDRWKVRVPVVGPLFKQMVLYRFMRSFGEIMGTGVMVLEALDLAGRVTGNEAFIADLEPVRQDVQRGKGLTEPLRRTGWFPASLLQVISSGEQSGRVPALLARAADILQRDIDLTLKRVVGRIEPILTVLMAVIVGVILLAVYLPMFDVMQHVGQ
jgi:type IV pilus assembly protein PilC